MINGPDFVALQVRDFEASRRFWMETVGLAPAPQSPPGAQVFATKPIPFAIRQPLVDLDATSRLGWGVALWMHADDAPALCERLRAAGVPIASEPRPGPFGNAFTFLDPDGYAVTVHDRA